MDTPECRGSGEGGRGQIWRGHPNGKAGAAEEIAPAYVFFASNADSSFVSGEVLALLGGETTAG